MPGWEVGLSGPAEDMNVLSQLFTQDELRITADLQGGYVIRSNAFNTLATSDEVFEYVNERVMPLLQGVSSISGWQIFENVHVGAVYGTGDDGFRNGTIYLNIVDTITVTSKSFVNLTVSTADGRVEDSEPLGSKFYRAVQIAPRLLEACSLLVYSLNHPRRLYFMYEFIKQHAGDPVRNRWITNTQKERFKHSMQDSRIYGHRARHGYVHGEPPANPMYIDEANQFIQTLIKEWVNTVLSRPEEG